MTETCDYCLKKFVNKATLKTHQKTAKYCLKIQNKETIAEYKCDGCEKIFSHLHHVNRHQKICGVFKALCEQQTEIETLHLEIEKFREYKEKYLEATEQLCDMKRDYERKIEVLQDKLENIAIQASTRTTTTTIK